MNSKRFAILGLLAVAVGVGGYWWSRVASERQDEPVGSVSIAASLTVSPAPIWVAHDKGFFRAVGLESTVRPYSSGKTTTEAMLKGETDLSASAEFLVASKVYAHPDLRILGTLAFVHQIQLLGLKDRGIGSVADIRGKRVAVKLGTNGEYFLERLLTLNSMTRDDIQWVDLKPQAMNEALAEGSVDAALVWPPFVQQIVTSLGDRVALFDGQPGQDYYYVVLGRQEWLEANPLVAERVMKALTMAEEWLVAHPEEARAYLSERLSVDPMMIGRVLDESRFAVTLPQALVIAMEAEFRWLEAQHLVEPERRPELLDLIAAEPLRQVAPARVNIAR